MKDKTTNTMPMMIGLAIAIAALSFFGGMKYQETKRPAFNRQFNGNAGQQGQRAGTNQGRNGFRPVNGEIVSNDTTSITVKMADGSSKIVLITSKTEINKADVVSADELKAGVKVAVFGQDNSDGSVTATNIQLNPMFRGMNGSPSATPKP